MALPLVQSRSRSKLSGRPSAIEQDLKRMVARELHDRVAQTLTGMLVEVENFKSEEVGWDDVVRQMDTIQSSTRQVLSSLRQLLHDLRGEEYLGDGFIEALGELTTRFEQKTSIEAELDVKPGWPRSITAPAALNLYRIVEEALANVRMHSGAHKVRIVLEPYSENELALQVGDNGRGVDTDDNRPVGFGTVGMKERAILLGGKLQVVSETGGGTTVHAVFPTVQLVPNLPHPVREAVTARSVSA